ncbi:MAG: tRNA 5-methoxyuridine(34)/uridine 5-oxyacetic acid(34) synthase CmoB [Luminiphilus sp.]|jgi:tRNA (mo5U34)-methyltransferase|nr:tRNA 5-methoxyuridine(34)/uridine 5-oxyacetic acid(34) synthase CmoB [Luminiphilus sp.]
MTLPPELTSDWAALSSRWTDEALQAWLDPLRDEFQRGLSVTRHGDLPRWRAALSRLPELPAGQLQLDAPRVGLNGWAPQADLERLETALKGLHPWRKGPFELLGLHIDTEWQSDWKWDRLKPALATLEGKRVLDVGCGNGYHCWRMLGEGAKEVIGIDPTPLFLMQFKAIQKYLQQPNIHLLPLRLEAMPSHLPVFDTVFSMGVLYHQRDPLAHLSDLRAKLIPGGQLILETLVIEGDEDAILEPAGRYARMSNVWKLPSPSLAQRWLRDSGFQQAQIVDVTVTAQDEQRRTEWMTFHSLKEFLNPEDRSLTIEGFPAPKRAILVAHNPS